MGEPDGFAARQRRLVTPHAPAPAVLVTKLVNVQYLSGFTGSNAALLVHSSGAAVLATDGRYVEQARAEAPGVELVVDRDVAAALLRRVRATCDVVAVEEHDLTVTRHRALARLAAPVRLVDLGEAVEALRVGKDEAELAAVARACRIADEAFAAVVPALREGVTERSVAAELEHEMRLRGADAAAFETIVAFGPHSAVPHHAPTDRPLTPGDLVKVDFGARCDGYHSDMTRTAVLGPARDWQREVHAVVAAAQERGRAAAVVGADIRAVDAAAREVVAGAGFAAQFPHGLGHGIGLEVHETPIMGYGRAGTLEDRTALTVEPGVYLPGRGGVRIEDTCVVRAAGVEVLTRTPRDLLEI